MTNTPNQLFITRPAQIMDMVTFRGVIFCAAVLTTMAFAETTCKTKYEKGSECVTSSEYITPDTLEQVSMQTDVHELSTPVTISTPTTDHAHYRHTWKILSASIWTVAVVVFFILVFFIKRNYRDIRDGLCSYFTHNDDTEDSGNLFELQPAQSGVSLYDNVSLEST